VRFAPALIAPHANRKYTATSSTTSQRTSSSAVSSCAASFCPKL
jgi:hypothetical protein